MQKGDKYKVKLEGFKKLHHGDILDTRLYYRLIALRDIPEHGVKAGDMGGLVHGKVKLSHEGSCWIAEEAMVTGKVTIEDDVYISGKASVEANGSKATILIKDKVRIGGNAMVRQCAWLIDEKKSLVLSGNAHIYENAQMINISLITGNSKVYGKAYLLDETVLRDNAEICDNAKVWGGSEVSGSSRIGGNAVVHYSSKIHDTNISGNAQLYHQIITNGNSPHAEIKASKPALVNIPGAKEITASKEKLQTSLFSFLNSAKNSAKTTDGGQMASQDVEILTKKTLESYNSIVQEIASYETDIVKIIQYPVMVDRTDRHTRAMILANNKAKRYMDNPAGRHFKDAVLELESAFLTAESNALKLASSKLSREQKKRLGKAKDLFSLAENSAATAPEKELAFQQGIKQLEGVILLPEIAVEAFKIKSGLKEIEA